MPADFDVLFPSAFDIENLKAAMPMRPFADTVIAFLADLSASLLTDREARRYPDVVTFAYFVRKANMLKLKESFAPKQSLRLGRGIVLHIAPSNVPLNFAYSFVAGLLAGNANVVRLPSNDFPQIDILIRHIRNVCDQSRHQVIADTNVLVRYPRTSDATAILSSMASVRVIWGGDDTIAAIRRYPLPPRAFDVCFADRYSVALIGSEAVTAASDQEIERLAAGFYNDTYLFDQNACSAPHLILWTDSQNIGMAKERFWRAVYAVVRKKYNFQDVLAVDKLTAFCLQAMDMDTRGELMPDNLVMRVNVTTLPDDIDKYRCAGGYFAEHTITRLSEISHIVSPKYQTLAYYGIDPKHLESFVSTVCPKGFDRMVPVGHTTDFSLIWDGFNLIDTLSRAIVITS